ncbi:HNH endonuclease [Vibrio splendidus]
MDKQYSDLGFQILESFQEIFENSIIENLEEDGVYSVLRLASNLTIRYRSWTEKPHYLILFKGEKCLYEIDLSRAVFGNDNYYWFLNKPRNSENQKVLASRYEWLDSMPSSYLNEMKAVKLELDSGVRVNNGGFKFAENETLDEVVAKLAELFLVIVKAHTEKVLSSSSVGINSLDSDSAQEGYLQDRTLLSRKRDQSLVKQRKVLDNYECQVCGFALTIEGKSIIECHHIFPLSFGERETKIEDLVCLCPTCHRIAHLRNKPLSLEEIKSYLQNI